MFSNEWRDRIQYYRELSPIRFQTNDARLAIRENFLTKKWEATVSEGNGRISHHIAGPAPSVVPTFVDEICVVIAYLALIEP